MTIVSLMVDTEIHDTTTVTALIPGVPSYPSAGPYDPSSHPHARAALRWTLDQFDRHPRAVRADLSPRRERRVVLYRTGPTTVVVIGDGDLAKAVRRLLPYRDWQRLSPPTPGMPVETLSRWLPSRILNALLRDGFATVEEIAAVPDEALATIRGLGSLSIPALREAVTAAGVSTLHPPQPPALTLTGAQQRELASLLTILTKHSRNLNDHDTATRARAFLTHVLDNPTHTPSRHAARRPGCGDRGEVADQFVDKIGRP